MALFGTDYNKAGRGISKNAPKKKAFFVFWEIYFRKFWKLIQLNFITFIFCIPIVTIGPALSGMTKVLRNYVLEKGTFTFHEFWKGFSKNLKQSIPVGIADILICLSAVAALRVYPVLAQEYGNIYNVLCVVSVSFAFTLLMMNFYIIPMIVATDLKLINIIKNAFFLTCIALKKNFITLVIVITSIAFWIVAVFLNNMTVILIPLLPVSFIGLVIMFNTYPQIQKYVIDPYYEERGEVNPEHSGSIPDEDASVFKDKGGTEQIIEAKNKKNKTIS